MTLTQLHEKRGELVTQARAALDEINKNTDESRSTELEQRHDTIMAEFDKIEASIAREEKQAKAERAEEDSRKARRPLIDGEERASDEDGDETGKVTYRQAFERLIRAGGAAAELSSETRMALQAGYSELSKEERTQVAGTLAAGGYTVPIELANEIVKAMKDWGPMYDPGVTREIVTGSGNEFDIPTNDDTAASAAALAEGADLTDDNSGDLVFGQKRLDAYVDATPWLKVSFELLQDSAFNIETFIAEALGERLGRRANNKLTVGTGSGQANGIVTASSLGFTAASATAIAMDEVLHLIHSVNNAYRKGPKVGFMFADTTLLALRKLKDGQGNYLWTQGDVRIGQPNMIHEYKYFINDDVPAIAAAARAILFGDMGRYWVRKVGAPVIGTVRERFWPKVGLAGLIRYDGELMDSNAVKHLRLA